MRNSLIWHSEFITYGLMILNVAVCAAALIWTWRRGYYDDLESSAADILVCEDEPSSKGDRT